jgi:hypothetical protein
MKDQASEKGTGKKQDQSKSNKPLRKEKRRLELVK